MGGLLRMKRGAGDNYAWTVTVNQDYPRHTETYHHLALNAWVLNSRVLKSPGQRIKGHEYSVKMHVFNKGTW